MGIIDILKDPLHADLSPQSVLETAVNPVRVSEVAEMVGADPEGIIPSTLEAGTGQLLQEAIPNMIFNEGPNLFSAEGMRYYTSPGLGDELDYKTRTQYAPMIASQFGPWGKLIGGLGGAFGQWMYTDEEGQGIANAANGGGSLAGVRQRFDEKYGELNTGTGINSAPSRTSLSEKGSKRIGKEKNKKFSRETEGEDPLLKTFPGLAETPGQGITRRRKTIEEIGEEGIDPLFIPEG